MALTLDTRARCVARPCCKKRALWALPRLYNTTLSTAPRTLSRASDSITVWGGGAEIQLLGTGLVMGSGKEGDSGVRNHKALQVASEVRETLD